MKDANPLPSFEGEPTWVRISGDIDTFTNMIWNNLNEDNKVSLFVRFIDIETGKYETRIINKINKSDSAEAARRKNERISVKIRL